MTVHGRLTGICSLSDGQEGDSRDAGGHSRPELETPVKVDCYLSIEMHLTKIEDLGESCMGLVRWLGLPRPWERL